MIKTSCPCSIQVAKSIASKAPGCQAGPTMMSDTFSLLGNSAYFLNEDYTETSSNIQTQSPYANNLDLDTKAGFDTASVTDDILDFTERNPFGEID